MTTSKQQPKFAVLIFLAALSVLPLGMVIPSLPHIADALGSTYAVANLAITRICVAPFEERLCVVTLTHNRSPMIAEGEVLDGHVVSYTLRCLSQCSSMEWPSCLHSRIIRTPRLSCPPTVPFS